MRAVRLLLTPMYGPAVRRKKFRRFSFRSCINVSGLSLERCVAPGHHGYQRAVDLISGQASTGPKGSPGFDRAGKTGLGGKRLECIAATSSAAPHSVSSLVRADGRSFIPACTLDMRRAKARPKVALFRETEQAEHCAADRAAPPWAITSSSRLPFSRYAKVGRIAIATSVSRPRGARPGIAIVAPKRTP